MPVFRYKARDKKGGLHEGEQEAQSREAVANRLMEDRLTPVLIEELTPTAQLNINFDHLFPEPKIGLDDMVLFCRQMHALTRSGIPIKPHYGGNTKRRGGHPGARQYLKSGLE